MMHPKILMAEDNARWARAWQSSLESAGFQVVQATNTKGAWKIMHAQDLALVLIDVDLPGLSQCNILLQVRADPNLAELPVVMLGDDAAEQVVRWLNLGADGFLSRTVSPQFLIAQIHAQLRRTDLSGFLGGT